jgi:hypothetical protein
MRRFDRIEGESTIRERGTSRDTNGLVDGPAAGLEGNDGGLGLQDDGSPEQGQERGVVQAV